MDETLVIGTVRTSHGVKGFMKVFSTSGECKHFRELKSVTLEKDGNRKVFNVEGVKGAGNNLLMKLEGVDTPEEARKWSGFEIVVSRDAALPLEEGEFYISDIWGCAVYKDGVELGEVVSVIEGTQAELLEIKTRDGLFLVPFLDEYIGAVDTGAGRIELKADWLLS